MPTYLNELFRDHSIEKIGTTDISSNVKIQDNMTTIENNLYVDINHTTPNDKHKKTAPVRTCIFRFNINIKNAIPVFIKRIIDGINSEAIIAKI